MNANVFKKRPLCDLRILPELIPYVSSPFQLKVVEENVLKIVILDRNPQFETVREFEKWFWREGYTMI